MPTAYTPNEVLVDAMLDQIVLEERLTPYDRERVQRLSRQLEGLKTAQAAWEARPPVSRQETDQTTQWYAHQIAYVQSEIVAILTPPKKSYPGSLKMLIWGVIVLAALATWAGLAYVGVMLL